mgnify:CR=1 FL=1
MVRRTRTTGANQTQAGFALIEALAAVVVLGIVGTTVVTGVFTLIKADAQQQSRSEATVVARNFADALAVTPYQDCAVLADYEAAALGLQVPLTSTLNVTSVTFWNGSTSPPADANPTESQWATAFGTTCSSSVPDRGLQRISFEVRSSAGGDDTTLTRSILKRFNGSLAEPDPDPPPGGRRCVIAAGTPGNVASTWVNEVAWGQSTNYSTGPQSREMNILFLAGTRRFSYVRFNVQPNVACENGGTLPAGANIIAAEVRLYTFNVGGLPACGSSCWHVMEQVRSAWNEATLTWANQPCPTGYGDSCQPGGTASTILFEHGTSATNPRVQRVQAAQLLSDVKAFFATPANNFGWVIKEACAETYGKSCGSISPGFQMASSRAVDPADRPTLTVFY